MTLLTANLNALWSSLMVEELVRLGCSYFVLSPGSRCAPLAAAVARNQKAKHFICFDERSSAFFALGLAKSIQKPVAIIVTSATAVANLMPAVVEASMSQVPLIILTADRPFELRQVGANQTIDQVKIFGNYVRDFVDLPAPDDQISASVLLSTIDQFFLKSLRPLAGPVHVNCMFPEPLSPEEVLAYDASCLTAVAAWQNLEKPFTQHWWNPNQLSLLQLKQIADQLSHGERGVIVVGEGLQEESLRAIMRMAYHLQWPIFADVTSGLRFFQDPLIVHYIDHLLLHPRYAEQTVDMVLQFGGRLTSKRLLHFLEMQRGKLSFFVDDHLERLDHQFLVTDRICADSRWFCEAICAQVPFVSRDHVWLKLWQNGSMHLHELFEQQLNSCCSLIEPAVARIISKSTSSSRALFLSSSMPIRDMNMFASFGTSLFTVGVNRGASGIDGIISTATGFAVGLSKPTTLLIGDLAFLHDSNGLSFLSKFSVPVVIVVINNQGGGIFSFLPIVKAQDIFREFFDTPHMHSLENISHAFQVKHVKIETVSAFKEAYDQALESQMHCVIEVMSSTDLNWKQHEYLREQAFNKLQNSF